MHSLNGKSRGAKGLAVIVLVVALNLVLATRIIGLSYGPFDWRVYEGIYEPTVTPEPTETPSTLYFPMIMNFPPDAN